LPSASLYPSLYLPVSLSFPRSLLLHYLSLYPSLYPSLCPLDHSLNPSSIHTIFPPSIYHCISSLSLPVLLRLFLMFYPPSFPHCFPPFIASLIVVLSLTLLVFIFSVSSIAHFNSLSIHASVPCPCLYLSL
jgi:hypothetical protein